MPVTTFQAEFVNEFPAPFEDDHLTAFQVGPGQELDAPFLGPTAATFQAVFLAPTTAYLSLTTRAHRTLSLTARAKRNRTIRLSGD